MQTLIIDLKSNPEVANVVAGLEPGTGLIFKTSIKSLDEQTLKVTLEEVEAPGGSESEPAMGKDTDYAAEVETEEGMIPDQE